LVGCNRFQSQFPSFMALGYSNVLVEVQSQNFSPCF